MSEASASPAADDQEGGVSQGDGDDKHGCLPQQQQQQQQQPHRRDASFLMYDNQALQRHMQSRTGGALTVSPPSPGDVGLEPPVRPRLSPFSTPTYSATTRTLEDLQGWRRGVGGRGGGRTRGTLGAADGGSRSRGTGSLVSAASELATHARCGSSGALEAAALPQNQPPRHRLGTHSRYGTVGLAPPTSPSTAKSSTQRSPAETARDGNASMPGTVGFNEHLPAEAAQRTPVHVNASPITTTTSPITAGAGMERSTQRVCRTQRSNPAGLTASAQAWHWGAAPVAAVAFQQQQQKGRGRQRRAVAASSEGTLGRRRGGNVPAPLFSNVPTTAAMGAAVAAWAHKSASSPSMSVSSPATKVPLRRTPPTSSTSRRAAVFPSPHATPMSSGGDSLPGAESPAALESSPTQPLSGRGTLITNTPTTELKRALSHTEAAPVSLTSKVSGEDAQAPSEATTAETPFSTCAPASSASVSAGAAAPGTSYDAAPHLGVPHTFATLDPTGTARLRPATSGTAAEGAEAEDDIVAAAAAGQQHLLATDQRKHGDDSRGDLPRVTSFASGEEGSIYSLVDSRQASEHACALPASATNENVVEAAAAVAATAGTARAFTGTEARTTLYRQGVDDAHIRKAPQSLNIGRATAFGGASSQSRAAGADAASGIPFRSEAAGAHVLGDRRRRVGRGGATGGAVASDSLEEEALLRHELETGGNAGIGSVNRAAMLKRSLTAPSHVTGMSLATASGGLLGSGTAAAETWPKQQHANNSGVLGVTAALGQRTTSVASNSFWSSSSANMNAISNNSIAGIAGGVSAINVGAGGLGSLVNSSTLFSGSSFTTVAGASTLRDPFAASVVMQQNKSALIAELKRRRHRLHKQLELLQKEATARNIFALVRASNASQLQYLLQEGLCNVNDRDYNGCTPLHVAAGEGNQAIVRVLLSFGADVVAVDNNGRTPLDCAAANRHSGVARYLLTVIRSKHLIQDGGDGAVTGSGGDDGSPATVRSAKRAPDEGSADMSTYPSSSTSLIDHSSPRRRNLDCAGGVLPLGNSPAGSLTLCAGTATQIDTSAQYQSASSGSSLMQSPRLPPPPSRQRQQQRHPVSSSLVASTPSPSRPSNLNRYPAKVTASVATMDAESWCDSDVPPHAVGWGIPSALAEAAAARSAPNQASAAADTTAASDPASRSLPQRHASQQGGTAIANSAGAYSTLTTHERVASMSTPRWRHNSIPHGSSPQRPVFLSSLDSTAAAHSRGLIAAESNAGAATTAPSSPPFSSSRSHESTVPLPITLGINGPATSFGSGSASVGGHLLERHVMSAPTYLADAMEECGGEDTGQVVMQQPPSRTRSSASLITTAAATAAGAIAGWHDRDEPLADTNAEGIFDAFLGRRGYSSTHRRRMQSESGSSPHGAFASASSDWLRSGSPPILSAGEDKQQRSRNDYNFNATGSFPGEVPSKLCPPPAPTAATGAATTAVATPATSAAACGGGAQQRQMLLRPPRRPDSRSPTTEWGGATTIADAVACPMRILHPLPLLGVDLHEELSGYHGRAATSMTSSTTAATAASGGGSPRGAGAASSSLCDMGQQSLEEHHHHYRLTAFGALGNQQQLKGKYSCDRRSTPPPLLQAPRAMSNPTKMEAAVAGPASPSGGGDGGSSAITKNGSTDVTPLFSVPAVAAPSSSSNTTADPAETTKTLLAAPAAAPAAAPTAGSHIAEEQPFLQEMHHEPVELAALHHSSYTTISDTVSVIVCMVGLPGRGKSFISKRLVRYMNWKGVPCKVFNAGNYRRQLLGVEATAGADFFNPDNPQGAQLRERMAELACEDLVNFIASHSLAVGILDATNTTRKRRAWLSDYFQKEAQQYAVPYRLLFIESVCTDDTIVTENILRSKFGNDDFRNLRDVSAVISEFRNRISQYEKVYETLEPEERMPYIKIVNVKHHVILHRVPNGLGSRIAFFLLNLHPIAFPIYVALPGETVGDSKHVYGGDERLTAQGEAYALALKHFIQDRYVPHMVVLHATNYCVLSTLAPLMEGATQEEDASALQVSSSANQRSAPAGQPCAAKATLAPADAVATTGGEPSTPNASSEAPQDPQQHDEGVAEEQSMHEDDSDQVDADEEDVGDEVLCAVPGLDNINFGRFSGHTAAWVKEKYPRLSALLYDVDDEDVVGDARAGAAAAAAAAAGQQHQSRRGSGEADATASSAPVGSDTAAEWLSAPLPPRVHYATHEEAVSHLQRALSSADPRLSYCTQLPNGESCRQVNVRLEPALMAVMRTQSPVFVVAPAVPAQGILSFFMDVIPEQSPTIRIPTGCVIEIDVKDGITVHPLLPNALPERMTRSPLTVLPEIQNAIREVAAASSMEMCAARTCAEVSASTQAGGCTAVGGGGAAAALLSAVAAGGDAGGSVKGDACPVSASAS